MVGNKLNIYNSESLRTYLEDSVKGWKELRRRDSLPLNQPGHYFNMEDFVAQEGLAFGHISKRKRHYQQRIMKHCFHNARCVVSYSRGNLTYVEGYCFSGTFPFPIHHAWATDQDGGVVEVTLPDGPAGAYLGIPFDIEYVRATATEYNTSIIDRWQDRWPLLQKPLIENLYALPNGILALDSP